MTKAATIGGKRRRKRAQAAICPISGVQIAAAPAGGEDWGATGVRAKEGTILEDVPQDANKRRRRRRLAPWEDAQGLGGKLSHRQKAAAAQLHKLHCATLTSPAACMVFVDRSPDYGLSAVARMHAQFKRAALWRHIPTAQAAVAFHVCALGLALRDRFEPFSRDWREADQHTAELMVALDLVANEMGI